MAVLTPPRKAQASPRAPSPVPPERQFSFTDFQVNNPSAPPPGDRLDGELDRVNRALNSAIAWVEALKAVAASAQTFDNGENDTLLAEATAMDYAVLAQAWAEHMPDTIPPNILAVMDVTGDHWSSRWWANRAAQIVDAGWAVFVGNQPPLAPIPNGKLWFDGLTATLYIRYDDGNSVQWVPVVNQPGPPGPPGGASMISPSISVSGSRVLASAEAGSVFVSALAGPATITLPPPLGAGHWVVVKDADGSAATHPITVQGNGGAMIDDMASYVIGYAYGLARFTWSGLRWSFG